MTSTPAPAMFAATFATDTLDSLTNDLLNAAAARGGLTRNMLADAFVEALEGERDTVLLGEAEMDAFRVVVDEAPAGSAVRERLSDAVAAFAPLDVEA